MNSTNVYNPAGMPDVRGGVGMIHTQSYRNPKVDELLNTASSTLDTAERKKLYAAFQKTVTDELPVIFINNSPYHTAARKNVGNLPTTVWGPASPYDEIFLK